MNTPKNSKFESFQTHISLINHHINFNSYKSNELMDIIIELSRMMIIVDRAEQMYQQNGKFEFIGTPEYHAIRNVINSNKMEIIKILTEL